MREGHIRGPGEGVFALLVCAFSVFLLWKAIETLQEVVSAPIPLVAAHA